jgi:D-alanyl-D-alanine carboxypeptidase
LDHTVTVKGLVELLERKPPAFEPGTSWAYSNVGFVLLGRVIEIVAGQDYYDYIQTNVFAPAGATSASFPLLPKDGVAVLPMAYPYAPVWDVENHRMYARNALGILTRRGGPAGSSITSALDLLKLYNAMRDGRIVTPETLRLHSSSKPELGAPAYGYGFIAGPYFGRPFIGHNGRSTGTCTESGELRDTPYTVIVLSNRDLSPAERVCQQVAGRILRVLGPS